MAKRQRKGDTRNVTLPTTPEIPKLAQYDIYDLIKLILDRKRDLYCDIACNDEAAIMEVENLEMLETKLRSILISLIEEIPQIGGMH